MFANGFFHSLKITTDVIFLRRSFDLVFCSRVHLFNSFDRMSRIRTHADAVKDLRQCLTEVQTEYSIQYFPMTPSSDAFGSRIAIGWQENGQDFKKTMNHGIKSILLTLNPIKDKLQSTKNPCICTLARESDKKGTVQWVVNVFTPAGIQLPKQGASKL